MLPIRLTRRDLLKRSCAGFGHLALLDLLARQGLAGGTDSTATQSPATKSPLSARRSHFPARAKRVIFLFMHGGPSQVDTFDYKPLLRRDNGQPLPFDKPRVQFAETGKLLASPWRFRQHGESGAWVSELFPHVSGHVDDISFIKSLHGSNPAHGGALLMIHTGSDTFVRPSMGSWISYGLGTENQSLPSFISICPTMGHGGVQNYSAAFLPGVHQGTRIGTSNTPSAQADIKYLENSHVSSKQQRAQLDLIREINRSELESVGPAAQLEARIQSFELAFRMQDAVPRVMDVSRESRAVHKLYGLDQKETADFGRQCLWARRFAEAGVRFVQCSHSYKWDQHSDLEKLHAKNAREVDRPIAALLADLKRRGLLEDTLVIWGGEFGRTPTAQGKDGRDHNPHGFTWWMAGGGVKPGFSYGATDDYGYYSARDKVHVHDLHATILHLLGLDHTQLTYPYAGREFRLTDVHGRVVREIVAERVVPS